MKTETTIGIKLFEGAELVAYDIEEISEGYKGDRYEPASYPEIIFKLKIEYKYENETYTRHITNPKEYYILASMYQDEILELYY